MEFKVYCLNNDFFSFRRFHIKNVLSLPFGLCQASSYLLLALFLSHTTLIRKVEESTKSTIYFVLSESKYSGCGNVF